MAPKKKKVKRPSRGFAPDPTPPEEQPEAAEDTEAPEPQEEADNASEFSLQELKRLCNFAQQALDDILGGTDENTVVKYIDRQTKEVFAELQNTDGSVIRLILNPSRLSPEFAQLVWDALEVDGTDPSEWDVLNNGWNAEWPTVWGDDE
jgi:hypothetical protein